jgi:hypothetical protein
MSARRNASRSTGLLILGFAAVCWGAPSDAPISTSVAARFVGQKKVVEATVEAAERDGNVVHLSLGKAPHVLTVSLIVGLLSDFPPDPEHYYLGKNVRVTGKIESFRDAPEITLHDAARIQILADAMAVSARPEARQESAASTPSLHEQVESLTERMRLLEERVRQLEHPAPR